MCKLVVIFFVHASQLFQLVYSFNNLHIAVGCSCGFRHVIRLSIELHCMYNDVTDMRCEMWQARLIYWCKSRYFKNTAQFLLIGRLMDGAHCHRVKFYYVACSPLTCTSALFACMRWFGSSVTCICCQQTNYDKLESLVLNKSFCWVRKLIID